MARLTFGYLYDFRNPAQWRKPWHEFYTETLDYMAWTETLGFEGVWVPEHHLAEDGYLSSPLTMLAAIAARTKTIKIGTAIALAPYYHPVRFAEECALIDILSNGRLELAIGVGYREREAEALGVPYKSRGSRTDEFIEIVRRLWAGETVNHEGQHFTIKNAAIVPSAPAGDIPLYIGGFSNRAIDRAVKYGDGYHGLIEMCGTYLDKFTAAGRDPATARMRALDMYLHIAKDPAKALDELAPYMFHMHNAYSAFMTEGKTNYDIGDDFTLHQMSFEEFRESGRVTVLTPSQAIDFFEEQLSIAPIEHYMLFVPPGLPLKQFAPYTELVANEVIPAFR